MLNLKPGRPLKTISYRSLPVNSNNLGKGSSQKTEILMTWMKIDTPCAGSEGEARVRVRLRMEWSRSSTSTSTSTHLNLHHHLKANKEAPDLLLKAGDK